MPPPPRHVSVALQVTEKLLSACDSRKLQLIVDSYLDILHNMLETSDTELHIMATNSVIRECVCMCVCVCVCECGSVGVGVWVWVWVFERVQGVNLFLFECTVYSVMHMSFHLVNSVLFVYNTLTPLHTHSL